MQHARFLDCLASDFDRLRTVAALDLSASVPTCPGWSVADLTRHVGQVYAHKTVAMREGAEPKSWPPPDLRDEPPLRLLERTYAELVHEFATRDVHDPAGSWYKPDQTVGFWIRRMAHETVIHRIDAELGTRQPVVPVPADLAVDGIDELLKVFLAYSVAEWRDAFTDVLASSPGRTYAIRTQGAAWRVRTAPGVCAVEDGDGGSSSDVEISGSPVSVLRWLWNRENPTARPSSDVAVAGAAEAVAELRRCIVIATQ